MLHDIRKEFRGAAEWGGMIGNVMSCKNKPATNLPVVVNEILDGLNIMTTFLQKISGELIEVCPPNVERLATTATAKEIFSNLCLRSRSRETDGIREALEFSAGKESGEGRAILNDRVFKCLCLCFP